MGLNSVKPSVKPLAGAIAALLLTAAASQAWAESGPFVDLNGDWSGNGMISISNGTRERIRCKASYSVANDGNHLEQKLRCASDTYKFEVNSNIDYNRGGVSGSWTELTRHAYGKLSGLASQGRISGGVEGSAFSASVAVITSGRRQTVTIRPVGQDVTQVQISLRKR